jgi:D-aspartate ligase
MTRPAALPRAPPAVIVGGRIGGLGLARSLRRAGVAVHVVGSSPRNAALWSRGVTPHLAPSLHGKALVDALTALGARLGGRAVLLLADEPAVFTVSEHRSVLQSCYHVTLPDPDVLEALSDKDRFQALAETHGWPVPCSVAVNGPADLSRLANLSLPAVVKPADKRAFHAGRARRIAIVQTLADLERASAEALEVGQRVIAQEWVAGADGAIFFCLFYADATGRVLSAFTGRKLRSYPPGIGSTGVCTPAPQAHGQLLPLTRQIAETVGFAGLGSMEFKWDEARGRFVIIEPTVGRIDQQEEVATLAGKNLPLAAYHHALGLPIDPVAGCAPETASVLWRDSVVFLPATIGAGAYDGYFRRNDPLPAVAQYGLNLPTELWHLAQAYGPTNRLAHLHALRLASGMPRRCWQWVARRYRVAG